MGFGIDLSSMSSISWIANAFKKYFWAIMIVIGFFWIGTKLIRR